MKPRDALWPVTAAALCVALVVTITYHATSPAPPRQDVPVAGVLNRLTDDGFEWSLRHFRGGLRGAFVARAEREGEGATVSYHAEAATLEDAVAELVKKVDASPCATVCKRKGAR